MDRSSTSDHAQAGWLASTVRVVLILGAIAAFVSTASAMSTADAEYQSALRLTPRPDHGAQLFELCSACHGRDGGGAADGTVPAIAGQSVPVLIEQLIEFRYDTRHSIRVQGFMAHHRLSAQNLADVAAYVSSLPAREPRPSPDTPQRAHGAALFASLCARCHGSHGEGNPAARVPRLAGQHAEYLAEQLRDAAEGSRPSMEHDHARLLAPLSVDDLNALAKYLGGTAPVAPSVPAF